MARIILVVPLFYNTDFEMPLMEYQGYTTLNGYLSAQGHEVFVIDAFCEKLSFNEVINRILEMGDIQYIGFTLMSSMYEDNMTKILEELQSRNCRFLCTFAGGMYASIMSNYILTSCPLLDLITIGDGEYTIDELVRIKNKDQLSNISGICYRTKNGEIKLTPMRPPLTEEELSSFPLPKHMQIENILKENGKVMIITSRGCYGDCTFCGVNTYGKKVECKKWRALRAERVIKEIKYLYDNYQVKHIDVADDNFIGEGKRGQERAQEIAKLIQSLNIHITFNIYCRINDFNEDVFRELKKVGLDSVFIGVEFGIQRALDFYNKGILVEQTKTVLKKMRDLSVRAMEGFIMFEPLMTLEEVKQNLKFYYENCDFKLYKLISRLEILKFSSAFDKLKTEIIINPAPVFTEIFGDVCNYSFKYSEVEILYECFKQDLGVIMPSVSYRYILNRLKENEHLINIWKERIYKTLYKFCASFDNKDVIELRTMKDTRTLYSLLKETDTNFYQELKFYGS
ncbi:B12-binding domain-containing radical SAM protein [Lachnotalea glycerini]|uniref:Radical SAM protein n=1 Tax=Lachnotalea glycerini TaxID=1763509 RepID=A0A371J9G6_9FIRM|nr:radical SAM protein [Lachnotalea glycerini]RDY29308.1 radical SAM protein [Lachnotalea glycerini]